MRFLRIKAIAVILAAIITVSLVTNVTRLTGKGIVRAESYAFTDIANITISEVKNGETDLLADPDTKVEYGDTITFKMEWTIPDGKEFIAGEELIFDLPGNIVFTSASGELVDNGRYLGTYSINDSKITIVYTDPDFCTLEINRKGSLVFDGKIVDNGNGEQKEQTVIVSFPGVIDLAFHMVPPAGKSDLKITKHFTDAANPNPDHIYDCIVTITSEGTNTNVVFDDEMWPGMYLYTSPEYFSDPELSVARTDVTDSTEAP